MLVISRKKGEMVYIGDNIKICVIEFRAGNGSQPGNVRLGIEAPREIQVDREEAHFRKLRSANAAGGPVPA